jgi:hypothetical protein
MGKLLSSAIQMQNGGAGGTATLSLYSELGTAVNNRARWFKNGVLVGTFTGDSIVTLNAGDTFYITAVRTLAPAGLTAYIYKNLVLQESVSDVTYTSATYTASAEDVFDVSIYLGF